MNKTKSKEEKRRQENIRKKEVHHNCNHQVTFGMGGGGKQALIQARVSDEHGACERCALAQVGFPSLTNLRALVTPATRYFQHKLDRPKTPTRLALS